MPSLTAVIRNPSGLHARPAAVFVRAAADYRSEIRVTNLTRDPERTASAKSILGVMQLGVACGHEVLLEAEGDDAEQALDQLHGVIEGGLGEELS